MFHEVSGDGQSNMVLWIGSLVGGPGTTAPPRRSIEECIALLPEDSPATIDEDYARDVAQAVAAHREPLNPPAWN
jgi:hypothetical protein